MNSSEGSLDDLRRQIDEIDAAIHDLLMRRTEVAAEAGALETPGAAAVRPGREAQVLRRLIARHRGVFPKRILVRVWREIMSALAALKEPLAVAAFAPERGADLRGLARDHFGSACRIAACETATSVLRQVTERQAQVGVLPVPQIEEPDPWWRHLARGGETGPRVIARLPFAALESARVDDTDGLVIALGAPEETGQDHSFLIIEAGDQLSRSRLTQLLEKAGLTAVNFQVWSDAVEHRLHLVEVEGHVPAADRRLFFLTEAGQPEVGLIWAVGGYAVPLGADQLAVPAGGAQAPGNAVGSTA